VNHFTADLLLNPVILLAMQGIVIGALMRPKSHAKASVINTSKLTSDKAIGHLGAYHYSIPNMTQHIRPEFMRSQSTPSPSAYRHHIGGSMYGLSSIHRQQTQLHLKQSQGMHDIIQPATETTEPPPTMKQQFNKAIKALWSNELLKDGYFLPYLINYILTSGCDYIPFAFIPDRANSYGIPKTNAAFLLSIIGIANTISRLVFGVVCDIPTVRKRRLYVYISSYIISGMSTALSFRKEYIAQVIYGVIFGIGTGK